MSALRSRQQPREVEYQTLRLTAVVTVVTGVVLLAIISFRFSYAAIHSIALAAGVSPGEARVYPLILDGMLVISCVAALALRGAEWWIRGYAWLLVLVLLAAMATLDAWHASGIELPHRFAAGMMALMPWVLLLLGLGLCLGVLRDLRVSPPLNTSGSHLSRNWPPAPNSATGQEAAGADRPDVSHLLPGFEPREPILGVERTEPAELGDPDEPAVRLLPPGPKPEGR
jgi:uncharacterized protein DUF2637